MNIKRIGYKIWKAYRSLQVPRNLLWQWWHGLRLDATMRLSGLPLIFTAGGNTPFTRLVFGLFGLRSQIKIGRNFTALSKSTYNALGVIQRVLLRTCSYDAEIKIGDGVGVSGCTICAAERIEIGANTIVGTGAVITDSDLHPIDPNDRVEGKRCGSSPVCIEENCFIGARVIILKGVRIGRGSTIGAGAVVAHSIPEFSIAVGNPARVVGKTKGYRS